MRINKKGLIIRLVLETPLQLFTRQKNAANAGVVKWPNLIDVIIEDRGRVSEGDHEKLQYPFGGDQTM